MYNLGKNAYVYLKNFNDFLEILDPNKRPKNKRHNEQTKTIQVSIMPTLLHRISKKSKAP